MSQDVDVFLEHFGVKGMRWGVRRSSQNETSSPKKSRREKRAESKAAKQEFYNQKAQRILAKSLEDPDILVALKTADTYPTIVTGREFVEYASKGGAFDVRYTDVYATKDSASNMYVLNNNMNERYKPKG